MTDGRDRLDPQARWWRLTRRALRLPDVMTDRSARAAVIGRLASELEGGDLPDEAVWPTAEAVLDNLLELGAVGSLDYCFVDNRAMLEGLRHVGVEKGRMGLSSGQGNTADTEDRVARAGEWLVAQIGHHAQAKPSDT